MCYHFQSTVLLRAWVLCLVLAITNSLSRQLREERENQLNPGLAIRAIARYSARDNFLVDMREWHRVDADNEQKRARSLEFLIMTDSQ